MDSVVSFENYFSFFRGKMTSPPFHFINRGGPVVDGPFLTPGLDRIRSHIVDELVEDEIPSKKKHSGLEYFLNKGKSADDHQEGRVHNMAEILNDVEYARKALNRNQDDCKLSDVLKQRTVSKVLAPLSLGQLSAFSLKPKIAENVGDLFPAEMQTEYESEQKKINEKWNKKEDKVKAKLSQSKESVGHRSFSQESAKETLQVPVAPVQNVQETPKTNVPVVARGRGRPRTAHVTVVANESRPLPVKENRAQTLPVVTENRRMTSQRKGDMKLFFLKVFFDTPLCLL